MIKGHVRRAAKRALEASDRWDDDDADDRPRYLRDSSEPQKPWRSGPQGEFGGL